MSTERTPAVEPSEHEDAEPLFRVLKGSPTEEEIAALTVAVLLQQQQQDRAERPQHAFGEVGRLLARRQRLGAGLRPGPGSWKRARPR